MAKIAHVMYGRVRAVYDTDMTFEEWRLAHSPAMMFVDVTDTDAKVGDDVDLNDDGSYTIVPQEEWYRIAEKRLNNQNTFAEEKEIKLNELNNLVANTLLDAFMYRVTVGQRTFLAMEKQALAYINDNKRGRLLQELAKAECVDVQTMAERIMECHNKIADTNDRLIGYYEKWHPQGAYYYSVEHGGFRPAPERTQGTYSKYNSIDDKIDDFFYYTTYIKYGIGRTTYDAAQEIRNEEITLDEGKALCKKFDGEYPDRFEKEIFKYLSLDRQHFPWASQLFEQPRMDREYFMPLADRFRSPHLWKWEDNMWKLRYTPYEGDSEVLWGDPRGTHHEV